MTATYMNVTRRLAMIGAKVEYTSAGIMAKVNGEYMPLRWALERAALAATAVLIDNPVRGDWVVTNGATARYVGTSKAGVVWLCYEDRAEAYEAMCEAFDARN